MEIQVELYEGILYKLPKVTILQQSPLLVAEYAGRVCYNSFANSEHEAIRNKDTSNLEAEHSVLMDSLSWVHHHESVMEHLSISFLIEGTYRGVLQEIVRSRIASYSVQSTRYTGQSVMNAFIAALVAPAEARRTTFQKLVSSLNMFVTCEEASKIEAESIYSKLLSQLNTLGHVNFYELALSKDARTNGSLLESSPELVFKALEASKAKRNVLDPFKHIVTDMWTTDLVMTMNLRALKGFLKQRDSGAAYKGIQWLAQAMKEATPSKYLDLIIKSKETHV